MRRASLFLSGLALLWAPPALAQLFVNVTHGQGTSGIVGYDMNGRAVAYGAPQPSMTLSSLSTGDSVCFTVTNAHAVFYNYSVGVTVDTASERLPDMTSAVALLQQVIGGNAAGRFAGAQRIIDSDTSYVGRFYQKFQPLIDSIAWAQREIKRSDIAGIAVAKSAVASLPSSPTQGDLDAWYNAPRPIEPPHALVATALKAYGQTLLSTREALRGSYASTIPEQVRTCGAVGKGKTTVRLDIKKKTDFGSRDAREGIATVVITPRYERGVVEAMPILFTAFVHDRPQFALQDGVVRRTIIGDSRIYRPGAVITINLPPSEAIAYGPFIGFGVTSENKVSLSDFLVGALVSYKNVVRIGAGVGNTTVVTGLADPTLENQPLNGTTKLEDLLVKGDKQAWYILVALPNLTLKSPWP